MKIVDGIAAVIALIGLTACSGQDWGQILKNTAAGTAEQACRAASNCSTGMRRDPVAPRPAWQTGGAVPKDNPYRLPAPK